MKEHASIPLTWIPAVAGMGIFLVVAPPARAQYIEYNYTRPSVETNFDIIGGEDGTAPPPAPVAPVEQGPVAPPPPGKIVLKPVFTEKSAAPAEEAEEEAEEDIVERAEESEQIEKLIEEVSPPPPSAPPPSPPATPALRPVQPPPPPPVREADEASAPPLPQIEEKDKKTQQKTPTNSASLPLPADLTLNFAGNESDMTPELRQKLDGVAGQLADLPETRLQLRAFATGEDGNTSSARRISLSRALSVRSYLMDKGIRPNRIDVRALGTETDQSPLDRVDMVFAR